MSSLPRRLFSTALVRHVLEWGRLPPVFKAVYRLGRDVVRKSIEDRITALAAEVAFFAVLSVFPGLVLLGTALGWIASVVGSNTARTPEMVIVDFLSRIFAEQGAGAVEAVEALFQRPGVGVFSTAALLGLYGLSRGFTAVVRALNTANDVSDRRPWWKSRLLGLSLAAGSVVIGALVLTMIVVGPFLGQGRRLAGALGVGETFVFLWTWLRVPFAFSLLVAWALVILHLSPDRRQPWRTDIPGALFSAVAWLLVSFGFSAYLRLGGGTNAVLTVLGGAFSVLIWLYLLSIALLVGAELNYVIRERGFRVSKA